MSKSVIGDPYYDEKKYHMANLFGPRGAVSPLCANKPRRINLNKGETWTIRAEAVTCKKCLAIMDAKARESKVTTEEVERANP